MGIVRRAKARRSSARGERAVPAAGGDVDVARTLRTHLEALRARFELLQQSQRALEKSRDRFLELFDAAPVPFAATDAAGILEELNLAGARLIGRRRDALLGVPFVSLVAEADRRKFLDAISRCRETEGPCSSTLRLR